MHTKTRDSLAIDDLMVGQTYEFLSLGKYAYRGIWLGMEGRYGLIDVPPNTMPLFPRGCHILRDLRWFAACKITALPRQTRYMVYDDSVGYAICKAVEDGPVHEARDALNARDRLPLLRRKKVALLILFCIEMAAAAFAAWWWWR